MQDFCGLACRQERGPPDCHCWGTSTETQGEALVGMEDHVAEARGALAHAWHFPRLSQGLLTTIS